VDLAAVFHGKKDILAQRPVIFGVTDQFQLKRGGIRLNLWIQFLEDE
jgi:hypothetical protein